MNTVDDFISGMIEPKDGRPSRDLHPALLP